MAASEERCARLETTDSMTGMKNFTAAEAYLQDLNKDIIDSLAVYIVDIDGLGEFNSKWGYEKGNQLICALGKAIEACLPEHALLARVASGCFWILIKAWDEADMVGLGNLILSQIRELKVSSQLDIDLDSKPTISIGSSFWNGTLEMNIGLLLMNANTALDEAKQNGGDQHIDYQEEQAFFSQLQTNFILQQEIEKQMHPALEHGEFFPVYQPQFDNITGRICGVELFARWNHPNKGILYPEVFIPIFEKNKFIIDLDMYMYDLACQTIRKWIDQKKPIIPLSCNFSGQNFINPLWVTQLIEKTEKYQISTSYIEIELSEKTLIEYKDKLAERIKELRDHGFVVAVDNFGTGYASLSLVQEMPVDAIKLDRNLLKKNMDNTNSKLILSGILLMAKMLHLQVQAVGVETKEQENILQKNGCHILQGCYYQEPVPLDQLEDILAENRFTYKKKEISSFGIDQGQEFAEMILQEFYIGQSIDHILDFISTDIIWDDVFSTTTIQNQEELRAYIVDEISHHNFLFNMSSCTTRKDKTTIAMSGEGILTEQMGEKLQDRRFCFFMNCSDQDGKLVLLEFKMTLIIGDIAVNARKLEIAMQRNSVVRQNQAVLELLYGVLPIGIIRFDATEDMVITYINDHMLKIIGYSREEFFHGEINGNIRLLVYPDDLEKNYTMSYQMMTCPETPPFTIRYIRKDGTIIKVLYHQCFITGTMGNEEVQSMIYEVPDDYDETMYIRR